MKERPIIFSGEMVRAILDGRKTQTRRVCKQAWDTHCGGGLAASVHTSGSGRAWIAWWPLTVTAEQTKECYPGDEGFRCPYGVPGDRLWVRETWAQFRDGSLAFAATDKEKHERWTPEKIRWKSSTHMPRCVSRISLEVKDVRVERLQEITEEDAISEGLRQNDLGHWLLLPVDSRRPGWRDPRRAFESLWDSINAKRGYGWETNPYVWCISFRRIDARLREAIAQAKGEA